MCVSLEKPDDDSQSQFDKNLARREKLKRIIAEKYPEVYELLTEYYEERTWW